MSLAGFTAKIYLLVALLLWTTIAVESVTNKYKVNFCMCNLDNHLIAVRNSLESGTNPPATPSPSAITTPTTKAPTPTLESTTTLQSTTTLESTSTLESTTENNAASGPARKKRSVTVEKSTGNFREFGLGALDPTGTQVVFDGSVKISDDVGISYDSSYKPSLCKCPTDGSKVRVGICILNQPYKEGSFASLSHLAEIIKNVLPWMDKLFMKEFSTSKTYIRTLAEEFTNLDGVVKAHFIVEFNSRYYLAEYGVKSAIEPHMKSMVGPANFVPKYSTNSDKTGCVTTEDITIPIPKEQTAFDYIRYLFIPVALGVLAALVFFLCCGKSDKFYVRFW